MHLRQRHQTTSNIGWHRPQSATSRTEEELMVNSTRALSHTTDPLEKLRLLCLSRGASGIMGLGRVFRRMEDGGSKRMNKEEFHNDIKATGLDISAEDVQNIFDKFDTDNNGTINIDEFLNEIRPPMSESRKKIVEQAFKKLDKAGDGVVDVKHIREVYSVNSNPRYMSGEETADRTLDNFLSSFDAESAVDGNVTFDDFMNFYSGISVSIDNDCFFDLMMRQSYKL